MRAASKAVAGVCLLLVTAARLGAARAEGPRLARVRYEKAIEVPALGAEELSVVNRLGSVHIIGWDRPAVRVRALKQAPTALLGERLRVQVTSARGQRISVQTYVRLRAALTPALRRRLRGLLERQLELGRLAPAQRAASLVDFERQVAAFRQALAREPRAQEDVSLPLQQARLDLEIRVPRHLVVRAKTFKHDLRVEGCSAGTRLSTQEGAISVVDVRGAVHSYAQRGKQRLHRIKGNVSVEGDSADIELAQIQGRVHAALLGGSIHAWALGPQPIDLRTIRGNIDVSAAARGRVTLLTLAGKVTLWLPRRPSVELRGRAGRWALGGYQRGARKVPAPVVAPSAGRKSSQASGDRGSSPALRGEVRRLRWGRGAWHVQVSTPEGTVELRSAKERPASPAAVGAPDRRDRER